MVKPRCKHCRHYNTKLLPGKCAITGDTVNRRTSACIDVKLKEKFKNLPKFKFPTEE